MKASNIFLFVLSLLYLISCEDLDAPNQRTTVEVTAEDFFTGLANNNAGFIIYSRRSSIGLFNFDNTLDTIQTDSDGIASYEFENEEDTYYRIRYQYKGEYYPFDIEPRLIKEGKANSYKFRLKALIPMIVHVRITPKPDFKTLRLGVQSDRNHSFGIHYFRNIEEPIDTILNLHALKAEKIIVDITYYDHDSQSSNNIIKAFFPGLQDTLKIELSL